MNLEKNDLEVVRLWAAKHPDILKVYLYGSRARGDNHPNSDIDLAIVMKPYDGSDSGYSRWFFWHMDYLENPDLHLSNEVQLEWYEEDAGLERVGPAVEKDGILLYSVR